MKPPCKDCPDRHINCHSECIRYLRWKEHQAETKAVEQLEKDKDDMFYQRSLKLRRKYSRKG